MKPHTYRYRVMESDLPPTARAIAQVLATRANYETGHVKVSVRKLAQWTGFNKDTVGSALQRLTLSGWLIVLAQKHERAPREYRLSVPVVGTTEGVDEGVDEGQEEKPPVPVVGTACPSGWDNSVPVVRTPIPLREFPACPEAPHPASDPLPDVASRDAIVVAIANGMRLP